MDLTEHLQRITRLKQDIRGEEIAIAEKMPPSEKLLAGPRLFDRACKALKARIRELHPEAREEDLRDLLREALAMVRRLEDLGCSVHLPDSDLYEYMFER